MTKTQSNPRVSVLMLNYNGEAYLKEAIESILNQTFRDFEFIIIDDVSSDNSADIIKSFDDSRIVFIQNEVNLRLPATLNKGLDAECANSHNLTKPLILRRVHPEQATSKKAETRRIPSKIRRMQLGKIGINPTDKEMQLHDALADHSFKPVPGSYDLLNNWFEKIIKANREAHYYSEKALNDILVSYSTIKGRAERYFKEKRLFHKLYMILGKELYRTYRLPLKQRGL